MPGLEENSLVNWWLRWEWWGALQVFQIIIFFSYLAVHYKLCLSGTPADYIAQCSWSPSWFSFHGTLCAAGAEGSASPETWRRGWRPRKQHQWMLKSGKQTVPPNVIFVFCTGKFWIDVNTSRASNVFKSVFGPDLQCTMLPLPTKSCLKSNNLRPILKGQFCHAISKNICLYRDIVQWTGHNLATNLNFWHHS